MALTTSPAQSVGRAVNRAKRQAIVAVPPVRRIATRRRDRLIARHAPMLPALSDKDRALVAALRRDAVAVTDLAELALPGTAAMQAAVEPLVAGLREQAAVGTTLRPPVADLTADRALWQFGLSERMLAIAENYLGLPVRYYGADVRREVADGATRAVRQWHRDIEDYRSLKILVWLNDVDDDGGPFAYVPVRRSEEAARRLGYVAGFVSDDAMRTTVPEDEWRTCPGPRWTAVLADNVRLMHRATPPRLHDRYSVTFTWTTRYPIKTMSAEPLTPAQARRVASGLSPRQLACLPPSLLRQLRS